MKKPIDLPADAVIGGWKPRTLLGQGGQGAVWSVKPVKVKHTPARALKACFSEDEQGRARFTREIEMLKLCDSPNILKIYDHDLEWKEWVAGHPSFAYYVAEKCQGSMSQHQAKLGDARKRIELFRQACAAVTHCHSISSPVIHRDIKPDNLLIAQELSNVVLADFGIARALSGSALTQAFEIVGTPYYRAPEMHHGEHGSIESDIYGLGRVLEWLLTGEVSTDMSTRPVPRGLELDDDACNLLDGIIAKATQVKSSHRYSSVQALVAQLPDLWLSMKPRPKTGPVVPDSGAATVFSAALELARAGDQIGWRQLQNQMRRDVVDKLVIWRTENERKWRGDSKESTALFTDTLLNLALGRMVFSLVGVYSNNSVFADQRQVVTDLLSVPNWNRGGVTAVVDAPRTLVFIYQYLHGALCMACEQPDLALQLAEMQVPSANNSDPVPLLKDYGLVGYPKLFGNRVWAWEYVCKLRERPVLEQFFALQSDFDVGLASYSMLLLLQELAEDAAGATPEQLAKVDDFTLSIPPLFTGMSDDTVESAVRRTFSNSLLVAKVAERAGAKLDIMRKLWAVQRKNISRFALQVFDRWEFIDRLPPPERLG